MNNAVNESISTKIAAPARVIICERTGRWAVALRRELAAGGVRVWETRTLADCWSELVHSPASLLVLELGDDIRGLVGRMHRLGRNFPRARLAVVADRDKADYEWLMREAGADWFTCSPRQAGVLARLACRHLAQVPPPEQSLTERIWAALPWSRGVGLGIRN